MTLQSSDGFRNDGRQVEHHQAKSTSSKLLIIITGVLLSALAFAIYQLPSRDPLVFCGVTHGARCDYVASCVSRGRGGKACACEWDLVTANFTTEEQEIVGELSKSAGARDAAGAMNVAAKIGLDRTVSLSARLSALDAEAGQRCQ